MVNRRVLPIFYKIFIVGYTKCEKVLQTLLKVQLSRVIDIIYSLSLTFRVGVGAGDLRVRVLVMGH